MPAGAWLTRAARVFRREPWWAEFWSALTALSWAALSLGTARELEAWPSMQVLLRLGDDRFWHLVAGGLGGVQLAALVADQRWLRWAGALAMAWFWGVLTLGVWAAVPWAPAVAVYAGWCGINVLSILRLLRRHGQVPPNEAGPWWVVLAAAIPSAGSGAWVIWRWWMERDEWRSSTHEQRLLRQLETQRAALGREHAQLFDSMRAELDRCHARLAELERDRDRGWDLARWWNRRAHELRHAGVGAQTAAQTLAVQHGALPPAWPDMNLPGLEDPR